MARYVNAHAQKAHEVQQKAFEQISPEKIEEYLQTHQLDKVLQNKSVLRKYFTEASRSLRLMSEFDFDNIIRQPIPAGVQEYKHYAEYFERYNDGQWTKNVDYLSANDLQNPQTLVDQGLLDEPEAEALQRLYDQGSLMPPEAWQAAANANTRTRPNSSGGSAPLALRAASFKSAGGGNLAGLGLPPPSPNAAFMTTGGMGAGTGIPSYEAWSAPGGYGNAALDLFAQAENQAKGIYASVLGSLQGLGAKGDELQQLLTNLDPNDPKYQQMMQAYTSEQGDLARSKQEMLDQLARITQQMTQVMQTISNIMKAANDASRNTISKIA